MTYEQWWLEVNKICENTLYISIDDMQDWCSADAYNDGMTPIEAFCSIFDVDSLEEITYEIAVSFV